MGEYYGVVRAPNYLSHALERGSGGGVGVYKNHKYIARAMTSSGKYRYFYDPNELAAYKQERLVQKNSLRKDSDTSPTGLSPAASSASKSLREKWEERRGMLSTKGGKGSGGSGGSGRGGGSSGRGGSGGGSGRASATKVINAVKPQEGPKSYGHLTSGALKYQGENEPIKGASSLLAKKKRKQIRLNRLRNARGVIPGRAIYTYRR